MIEEKKDIFDGEVRTVLGDIFRGRQSQMEVAPQHTQKLKMYGMDWIPERYLIFVFFQIVNVLFSFALCVVLDYAEYTYK